MHSDHGEWLGRMGVTGDTTEHKPLDIYNDSFSNIWTDVIFVTSKFAEIKLNEKMVDST